MATSPFLAEIRAFSFGLTPKGWAQCSGQLLPITQNQALYSLLGTTYGGNGTTTFALPDLRGRVSVGVSSGVTLGQIAGTASVTLIASQIPAHTHNANGSTALVNATSGTGTPGTSVLPGTFPAGTDNYAASTDTALGSGTVGAAGSQAHENRQPYLALNFCIALTGIFPPRS